MVAIINCGKLATGLKNNVVINLIRTTGCLVVSLLVCLIVGFSKLDGIGLFLVILSGVAMGLMMVVWLLSTQYAQVILVEVFAMIGGVIVPLFLAPYLINGDNVSLLQWIGAFILIVALFLFSKGGDGKKLTFKGILLLLSYLVITAVSMITQTCYSYYSTGSSEDFQLYTFLFATITLIIMFIFISAFHKKSDKTVENPKFNLKVIIYISIAIVFLYIGNLLSKLSTTYLPQTVFYPFSYVISMPLIFITEAIVYKQKVTFNNILALILVVASGILVNL